MQTLRTCDHRARRRRVVALLAGLGLVASACSNSRSVETTSTAAGTTSTVEATTQTEASVTDDIQLLLDNYASAWNGYDGDAFLTLVTDNYIHESENGTTTALEAVRTIGQIAQHERKGTYVGEPIMYGENPWHVAQATLLEGTVYPDGSVEGLTVFAVIEENGDLLVARHTHIGGLGRQTTTTTSPDASTTLAPVSYPGGATYVAGRIADFVMDKGTRTTSSDGTYEILDGTITYTVISNDARVSGTGTGTWHGNRWGTSSDGAIIQWGEETITNENGTWETTFDGFWTSSLGDVITYWWQGTGDYESLTFHMVTTGDSAWEWVGLIYPGTPPPQP